MSGNRMFCKVEDEEFLACDNNVEVMVDKHEGGRLWISVERDGQRPEGASAFIDANAAEALRIFLNENKEFPNAE